MKIGSILVVCVGNICRSPLGERMLAERLPDVVVASAGLEALVGQGADAGALSVAAERGIDLDGHCARQFDTEFASHYDLILVMEPGHRREIAARAPELSGRVMVFDQWTGGTGIADPYRRSRAFHEATFERMQAAADAWTERLGHDAR